MSPALADRLLTTGQPENSPNSTLKCCTQNLMCSETQQRDTSLKEAWVRPTWWFWRSFQIGKGQWGSSWGLESWPQKFWGAYSTTKTLVLTSTILESSLCLISAEGLPAHQQAPTQSQDIQDVRQPSRDLASSIGEPAPDLALLAAKASCPRTGPADQKGQQTLYKAEHVSKWGRGPALPISIPTIVNPTRATEPTQGPS